MMFAILLAIIPFSPVIEDHVTTYEINHFYDDAGVHVFSQRIFYDDDGMVIDWRMIKRPTMHTPKGWLFWDKDGLRRVSAKSEIETWTQIDRELLTRAILPLALRKGLGNRP